MSLADALKHATADDILEALLESEVEDVLFDLGLAIHHVNPSKTFPGEDPYAIYDEPSRGTLWVEGFDPKRRKDALLGAREMQLLTVMESLAFIKALSKRTPFEISIYGKEDALETKAEWEEYGFTVTMSGFGESRGHKTHVRSLQRMTGPQIC